MKIQSLIERENGTIVDLEAPNRTYHFKPTAEDARHIAEVDLDHHAKTLLRIKEGYRAVDNDADFGQDDENNDRHLNGSTVHNASYTIIGGDTISLADLIDMAFDDSALTEEEWNALDDADRYAYIDTTLKELVDGDHGDNEQAAIQTEQSTGTSSDTVDATAADDAETGGNGDQDTTVAPESAVVDDSPVKEDADANGIADNLDELKGEALIAAYEKKFGRKPSSKMKVDDIRRALSEDDD